MSSALAMVLMAGMVVPGSEPKKVSGEVEQRLDLSGKWEGTWEDSDGQGGDARLVEGKLWNFMSGGNIAISYLHEWTCVDEGGGRLRGKQDDGQFIGIYEQVGDRIFICYRSATQGRPKRFRGGNGQWLLILHRAKPDR